ncbi:MAG: hypothetical protein IKL40_05685 [Clostridia bacterium]|nr:hypothetical protein [Clostridia bacterium]
MNDNKIAKKYMRQKKLYTRDIVFGALTGVGGLLAVLFLLFNMFIGFWGIPLLIVGGIGMVVSNSMKVKDDDYENELKRIMKENNVEKDDMTLCEYIFGKSDDVSLGKDRKLRSAYYGVTKFAFKNNVCSIIQYEIDIFAEEVRAKEYSVPCGCKTEIVEVDCPSKIGVVKNYFLRLDDNLDIMIPVNMKIYDTDAMIEKIKYVKK